MTLAQFFDMHRVAEPIVVPSKAAALTPRLDIKAHSGAQSEELIPAFLAAARRRKKKQRSR